MTNVVQDKGRALKRLVAMFGNISSIEESKKKIAIYLKVNKYIKKFNLKIISF
jgi:hypothetical protein